MLTKSSGSEITGNVSIADGKWHHIACVRESDGTVKIYIDGVLDKAETLPLRNVDVSLAPRIGCDTRDPYTAKFNGLIDEVSIYGRALSPAEVQALKNKCSLDSDNDGLDDESIIVSLNLTAHYLGTCSSTSENPEINCTSDADCANGCSSNGLCIKDQRMQTEMMLGMCVTVRHLIIRSLRAGRCMWMLMVTATALARQ